MKEHTRKFALAGIFASLIFILAMTPLGLIPIGSINLTIVHIPIIIIALLYGVKTGLILGFSFGLATMLAAFGKSLAMQTHLAKILLPHSSFAVFLAAILPALAIPIVTNIVYKNLLKLNRSNQFRRKRLTKSTIISYSAIAGTLAHTVIFAVIMGISLASIKEGKAFSDTFFSLGMLLVVLIEAAAAALISSPIVRTITDYNDNVIKSKKPKHIEPEPAEEEDLLDVAVMPTTESLLPKMNEETIKMHSKCMGFFNSGAYELSIKLFDKFEEEFSADADRFYAKLYVIMRFIEAYQYKTAEKRLVKTLKFAQGLKPDDSANSILMGIIKIIKIANTNASANGRLNPTSERSYSKAIDFVNKGAYLLAAQMLESQICA